MVEQKQIQKKILSVLFSLVSEENLSFVYVAYIFVASYDRHN